MATLEYLSAEHKMQYQQTLFDLLLKQYDAARMDEAKEAAIIQVVELAIPPERQSSPKRAILVVLFSTGGLCVGCVLALALWWRDLMQSDPVIAEELEILRSALTGRVTSSQRCRVDA